MRVGRAPLLLVTFLGGGLAGLALQPFLAGTGAGERESEISVENPPPIDESPWTPVQTRREIEMFMESNIRDTPAFKEAARWVFRRHWKEVGDFLSALGAGKANLQEEDVRVALEAIDLIRDGGTEAMSAIPGVLRFQSGAGRRIDIQSALSSMAANVAEIEKGLVSLLSSSDPGVRRDAILNLSLLPVRHQEAFAGAILSGLRDESASVRRCSAENVSLLVRPLGSEWDVLYLETARIGFIEEDLTTRMECQLAVGPRGPQNTEEVDELLSWAKGSVDWEDLEKGYGFEWVEKWPGNASRHLEGGFDACDEEAQLLRLAAMRSAMRPVAGIVGTLDRVRPVSPRVKSMVDRLRRELQVE